MVPQSGIEPLSSPWRGNVLPLNDCEVVPRDRFERPHLVLHARALPTELSRDGAGERNQTPIKWLRRTRSVIELHRRDRYSVVKIEGQKKRPRACGWGLSAGWESLGQLPSSSARQGSAVPPLKTLARVALFPPLILRVNGSLISGLIVEDRQTKRKALDADAQCLVPYHGFIYTQAMRQHRGIHT